MSVKKKTFLVSYLRNLYLRRIEKLYFARYELLNELARRTEREKFDDIGINKKFSSEFPYKICERKHMNT